MPHLTILALGSRGDVLPYVVLGAGLQASGFAVRMVTFASFAPLVARHNLEFTAVPGDAEQITTSSSGISLAESGYNVWRMWRSLKASYWQLAASITQTLSQPAIWQTDAILNQLPGGLFGFDLAETLGIPHINVAVMPLLRTRAFPMLAFPPGPAILPGYTPLTYRVAEQLVWSGFRGAVNRWRQSVLGLPPQSFWGRFGEVGQLPTLLGFSEQIVPRPPDWGANVHYTGYWRPQEPEWTPPEGLQCFLEAGVPPVFIGFGSMPVRDPQRVTQIVLKAIQLSGQRAILHAGWAGIGDTAVPDAIYQLDYAPYGWLFPQMAAVVHHGGSGTTGFGFWAGLPTVLVPFLFDQFYWGRRIVALGVGPEPVPYKALTAERLAAAIDTAVTSPHIRQRTAELGQHIRQEDGVGTAVKIVKQIVGVKP
ncbi:MAG: glycosyltransferase family 1 protein [Anaerolineae bacterium]|nr:glycosyltransferase family 1 protein [Anaerolineae bacterium]